MRARMTRMSVWGAVLALVVALVPAVPAAAAADEDSAARPAGTPAPTPTGSAPVIPVQPTLPHLPVRPSPPLGTATVTGRIAYPPGTGSHTVSDVKIFSSAVMSPDAGPIAAARVAADGRYTIRNLPAGKYKIYVSTTGGGLRSEWWNNAFTPGSAALFTVAKGKTHRADIGLEKGASISGRVSAPAGALSAGGTRVVVTSASDRMTLGTGIVEADGRYTVGGLGPGKYKVEVQPRGAGLSGGWWRDAADFESAPSLVLSTRQARTGIDLVIRAGARITGTVRTTKGAPVPFASVSVSRESVVGGKRQWHGAGAGTADDRGAFSFSGLPAGRYRVHVLASHRSGLVDGWYGGTTEKYAKIFTVATGKVVSGIDVRLGRAGAISGRITADGMPVPSTGVHALRWMNGRWQPTRGASSDASGRFTITELPAGTYVLRFIDDNGGHALYENEYWKDARTAADAVRITVTAGKTVTGINAVIARR